MRLERGQTTMALLRGISAFALVLAGSAWAQQPAIPAQAPGQSGTPAPVLIPRTHEERDRRYQAEHLIVLNVLVTDRSGKPVTGLRQGDFTVLDNGQPRKLVTFRAVEGSNGIAPVRVILMLDAVNNSPKEIAGDRKGVEQFLAGSPGRLAYPTSVGILTGAGANVSQPSRDRDAVLGQLRLLTRTVHMFDCESEGAPADQVVSFDVSSTPDLDAAHVDPKAACLNRRFLQSVSALKQFAVEQENVQGRAILIWIGAGWPLLLNREFREDPAGLKQNLFDNLALISNALREGQITLDTVFSPDLFRRVELRSDHDNAYFNGVPREELVMASSLGLQVLAHQSGGLALIDGKDLAAEIARCVGDAQWYYSMSFDSPPAGEPGEFHSLDVKTDDPALTVRTNTDYYAEQ